jgi:hypothetical protein
MAAQPAPAREILLLVGHTPLRSFVRLVKARDINGLTLDDAVLTQEWMAAKRHIRDLETTQPGVADVSTLNSLPESVSEAAEAELRDPRVQRSFRFLPCSWAMVELDRLIPWQSYVDLTFVGELRATLPAAATLAELIRFSMGKTREPPPINVMQKSGNKFVIVSRSSDLRVTDTAWLAPEQVQEHQALGHTAGVIGVFLGYSNNVMYAVRARNRLLLANGTHRAYALRAHGVTHAPCVVQHVANEDEMDLVAAPSGTSHPFDWYFKAPRPPLLKDFFDERFGKVVSALPDTHSLEVELTFQYSVIRSP